jgi:hypothetical protein
MTRLRIVLTVVLGLASVMRPTPVSADGDAASVTGAGEAIFSSGATFAGLTLNGLQLGQGLFIAQDGSAVGQFHAVLHGTSLLGQEQDVLVEAKTTAGSATGNGSVTFSGTATVDMGDGTPPLTDIPFAATVSTNSLALVLNATSLPTATLTAGSITIE